MSAKTIISLVLIASIHLSLAYENQDANHVPEKHINATQQALSSRRQYHQDLRSAAKQNATSETLESAPTVTSIHHQVWTSSSSGRLDELSPEVISKLRNDVPFLTAYAIRPRLVGAPSPLSSGVDPHGDQQTVASEKLVSTPYVTTLNNGVEPRLALMAPTTGGLPIDVGASSPQAARQSLVPKLGDFSELNVETSSLSKSEHHHKRKTSLKRPSNKADERKQLTSARNARKRVAAEDSLSQLVKRVKQRQQTSNKRRRSPAKHSNSKKGARSRGRSSKRKSGKRRGAARRTRSNKRREGLRIARFMQNKSIGTNDLDDGEMRPLDRGADSVQTNANSDGTSIKGGPANGGGDVKGGSPSETPRKPPFFAAGRKPKKMDGIPESGVEETDRSLETNNPNLIGGVDHEGRADGVANEDAEIDDEPQMEPKRVGDVDVEEDGDTVLVEPKSDGVDDDPPLPDLPGGPDEAAHGEEDNIGGTGDERDKEETTTSTPATLAPEGDPRGNRVNRQKPNELAPPSDERSSADGGQDQVAGGGIGATVDGAGASAGGRGNEAEDDDEFGSGDRKGVGAVEPGVEFADDEKPSKADDDAQRMTKKPAGGERPDDAFDDDSRQTGPERSTTDGNFGERRQNDDGPRGSNSSVDGERPSDSAGEDGAFEDDLDYRDEIEKRDRKGPALTGADEGAARKESSSRGTTGTGVNATRGHPKTDVHCDDSSHDHHGDDHGDNHHGHHDTIDWLRGAIPGEPDDDYPILSRVNVTNFSCADQKHPGYYADVEARCQIFHICQADGRQDSFLCPNGTIFSQKSLVCVWWDGFHCEDAPKFYHLNELLYKTTDGNESPQAVALPNLRPLDGSHLKPRSMKAANGSTVASANDDDPPIDDMMQKTMRGRRPHETGFMGGAADGGAVNRDVGGGGLTKGQVDARNNIGPDDDATIQRKSTNLDDSDVEPPARLRARDHAPRRRRRASAKQAPPKLKSRRVSRNSRRRKLRHGIKPRRRA